MNTRQKVFLWIAVIGGIAMGMFPPWHHRYYSATVSDGYAFICHPPLDVATIDSARFAVQFCTLTFATIVLTLVLRPREGAKTDPPIPTAPRPTPTTNSSSAHIPPQRQQRADRQGECLGGWLILPALGLLLGPLVVSGNIHMSLDALRRPALPADVREFVTFTTGLLALFLLMQLYTAYQFFRRRTSAPMALVMLFVANFVVTLVMGSEASEINPAYQAAPTVMGAAIVAAIWIPYFLLSPRVKRTFVR